MKFTFLGTGSAFTVAEDNYQSNMLVESSDGKRLLIDCGSDARRALNDLGLSYREIDHVYISHLHSDHCGGLEWLAFTRKFDHLCKKPRLFLSSHLVKDLWKNVLSGGLNTLEGKITDLSTYFEVNEVEDNVPFLWENVEFNLVQTIHVVSGFCIVPSYGLLFSTDDQTVFVTTDSQLAPHQIHDIYHRSTIIFQDCEIVENPSHVHAHYKELRLLPPEIKSKMWLYHYSAGKLPDAKADGFRGFAKKGQCFDFSDKKTLY